MPETLLVFLVYLFYGGVFFAIGVAVLSRSQSFSNLRISGLFWLFGLFALLHGLHEWLELYLKIQPHLSGQLLVVMGSINLLLVFSSFLLLFFFGASLHEAVCRGDSRLFALLLLALLVAMFGFVAGQQPAPSVAFFEATDFRIRNLIGFPATMVAGSGLVRYSQVLLEVSRKGGGHFKGAGLSLMVYGVLTGLVPSSTTLPLVSLPVEVLRGGAACVILHCIMYGLDIFVAEREQLVARRLQGVARAEKLSSLGRLAAGVAHEINNPLASALLNLELLRTELPAENRPAGIDKRLAGIERNLERGAGIARELLSFASDRDQEVSLVATEVRAVVCAAWRLLGPLRRGYRLQLDVDEKMALPMIELKIEEVFLNLFLNAIDAMPAGGTISVAGRRQGKAVVVAVSDTGCGIAAEHLDRVMDPFFTTKEQGKGTGLGLSVCYGIMELHHGGIGIRSQPGGGTTVLLTFPATEGDDDGNPRRG